MAIKKCIICKKEFQSNYLHQKICLSEYCKKEFIKFHNHLSYLKNLRKCPECENLRDRNANLCRSCASKKRRGSGNSNWKGGIKKASHGYIYIKAPKHPHTIKEGYVYEHILVMEQHLGRYLIPEEVVHHIDFNPSNNSIENLHLFSNRQAHNDYHAMLRHFVREELKNEYPSNITSSIS